MGVKSGVIIYNVKERGRQYRGVERNLDCVSLAKIINGPEVQERVKSRDMHGYFGHWPRMKFGMEPPEGVIVDGAVVVLDHAFVTTHLVAHEDGTIEHEAETMDNVPGRAVADYWASKTGGFSSAITPHRSNGEVKVPKQFHGFDYVREPNYNSNRPFEMTLDSVAPEDLQELFDGALVEYGAALAHLQAMYDGLRADHHRALETITRMDIEQNDLLGRLAAGAATFDSAAPFVKPLRTDSPQPILDSIAKFGTAPLAELSEIEKPESKSVVGEARKRAVSRLLFR